jgi:hypothetical protein
MITGGTTLVPPDGPTGIHMKEKDTVDPLSVRITSGSG